MMQLYLQNTSINILTKNMHKNQQFAHQRHTQYQINIPIMSKSKNKSSTNQLIVKQQAQQGQELIIGLAKFRSITSLQRKRLINKNMRIYNNQTEWVIDYNKFQRLSWKQQFPMIESSAVKNLWLNNNDCPQILKCICFCKFNELQILNLDSNKITNVQPLTQLHAPKLYRLQLSENLISDIKTFRKVSFPLLSWLTLNNNKIKNLQSLTQVCMPQLQKLQFHRKPYYMIDESVNWLSKLETTSLKRLDCLTFKRISQYDAVQMIKERYGDIDLEWSTI